MLQPIFTVKNKKIWINLLITEFFELQFYFIFYILLMFVRKKSKFVKKENFTFNFTCLSKIFLKINKMYFGLII